jgi:glycosyltransferase involved in cell wall biosynthesis
MKNDKKVLIIVPAYNEENAIGFLIKEIKKLHPSYPIVVINDGSSDNTAEAADSAGAYAVSLPFNLGIGGAVQTAFKIAHDLGFDATIQIDGDAQHDPRYLKDVLEPVLAGKLDLCIGSRFIKKTGFKSTVYRRVGINFFASLLRVLTGVNLTDPTSGFRATSKKLIADFAHYYPVDFPEPEAIKVAKRLGAKIGEVPVNMRKRLGGKSSLNYLSMIYYMIKVTFAILLDTLRKKEPPHAS